MFFFYQHMIFGLGQNKYVKVYYDLWVAVVNESSLSSSVTLCILLALCIKFTLYILRHVN